MKNIPLTVSDEAILDRALDRLLYSDCSKHINEMSKVEFDSTGDTELRADVDVEEYCGIENREYDIRSIYVKDKDYISVELKTEKGVSISLELHIKGGVE